MKRAVHVLVFDGFADWEPAPIEFAREIFKQLRVFSPADEDIWFDMFRHGRLPQSAN
jgi:hypothetical protein